MQNAEFRIAFQCFLQKVNYRDRRSAAKLGRSIVETFLYIFCKRVSLGRAALELRAMPQLIF
jgi:hypothetical protein